MKKKNSLFSKLKTIFIVGIIIGFFIFLFSTLVDDDSSFYNIQSGSQTFGTPVKKADKSLDSQGYTEGFWTNNKFKW